MVGGDGLEGEEDRRRRGEEGSALDVVQSIRGGDKCDEPIDERKTFLRFTRTQRLSENLSDKLGVGVGCVLVVELSEQGLEFGLGGERLGEFSVE